MIGSYKGVIKQMMSDEKKIKVESRHVRDANEIVYSNITEIDLCLDNSRFHISMPIKGTESYIVDGVEQKLSQHEYFIFNPQQLVCAQMISNTEIEGFCIYLSEKTINDTFFSMLNPEDKLPESIYYYPWKQQEFMVKNYSFQENSFGCFLNKVKHWLLKNNGEIPFDRESFFIELAAAFLSGHKQIGTHLARVSAMKVITRQEIYRRLSIGYSYISDNYANQVSLDDLEKITFISKYHLIRLYRSVYGITPYQHLLQLKIEKAKLLLATDYSATDIATELSFTDRRAFSSYFKKMTGASPSVFQRKRSVTL